VRDHLTNWLAAGYQILPVRFLDFLVLRGERNACAVVREKDNPPAKHRAYQEAAACPASWTDCTSKKPAAKAPKAVHRGGRLLLAGSGQGGAPNRVKPSCCLPLNGARILNVLVGRAFGQAETTNARLTICREALGGLGRRDGQQIRAGDDLRLWTRSIIHMTACGERSYVGLHISRAQCSLTCLLPPRCAR